MEGSEEFLLALEQASNCRLNHLDLPLNGFLKFESKSKTDQSYQDAFNILISLNIQLIEKVNKLTELIIRQVREKEGEQTQELDSIIETINKLSIKDSLERRESLPSRYLHWEGKKNDE